MDNWEPKITEPVTPIVHVSIDVFIGIKLLWSSCDNKMSVVAPIDVQKDMDNQNNHILTFSNRFSRKISLKDMNSNHGRNNHQCQTSQKIVRIILTLLERAQEKCNRIYK